MSFSENDSGMKLLVRDANDEIREHLELNGYEDSLVFENPNFDRAFIGLTHDGRVAYSFSKMIKQLAEDAQITEEQAREYIEFNTMRSLSHFPNSPVVIYEE